MQRKSYIITAALVVGLALGIIFSPIAGSTTAHGGIHDNNPL